MKLRIRDPAVFDGRNERGNRKREILYSMLPERERFHFSILHFIHQPLCGFSSVSDYNSSISKNCKFLSENGATFRGMGSVKRFQIFAIFFFFHQIIEFGKIGIFQFAYPAFIPGSDDSGIIVKIAVDRDDRSADRTLDIH